MQRERMRWGLEFMRPLSAKTTTIEIEQVAPGQAGLDLDWLRRRLDQAVGHIDQPARQINIAIVDDRRMIKLHRQHCGIDSTTDVLTFPPADGASGLDLAVNLDEADRQSVIHGHSIQQELSLYCLHGMLHCAGFDDHDAEAYQAMHAEEDRILTAIGVGATFGISQSTAADESSPSRGAGGIGGGSA